MSVQGYANQDFVDQAHNDFRAEREQERKEAEAAAGTRQQLETPADPAPEDDAPATAAEEDEETESDGGRRAFVMTQDRRVGSIAVPVDGHGNIRFGKPSGRASMKMIGPIEDMEEENESASDLGNFIWPTLGQWAIDDEYDEDFFADEMGMLDAITTLRSVALGGNPSAI